MMMMIIKSRIKLNNINLIDDKKTVWTAQSFRVDKKNIHSFIYQWMRTKSKKKLFFDDNDGKQIKHELGSILDDQDDDDI